MLEISTTHLRQLFIDKIVNNTVHQLLPTYLHKINVQFPANPPQRGLLPFDRSTLHNYHYLLRLAETYTVPKYNNLRYSSEAAIASNKGIDETSNFLIPGTTTALPFVSTVIYKDISKVNAFICAVAWLSSDEFKWHIKYPEYQIPEDLSYGLVLQYPDFIIPYCCVLADYKREECYTQLQSESLKLITKYADEDLALYYTSQ